MPGSKEFLKWYWASPEAVVKETDSHRCARCANLRYADFRADDAISELLRPVTVDFGSFKSVQESAFSGCWACRLVFRAIVQTTTTLEGTALLCTVSKVGLGLSLDDELVVRCLRSDGSPFLLMGLEGLALDLKDAGPSGTEDQDQDPSRDYELVEIPPTSPSGTSIRLLKQHARNKFVPNPPVGPDLLFSWLYSCSALHDDCPDTFGGDEPALPTRVLDLFHQGGPRVVETRGRKGEFVTLSHCWGQSQHNFKLTRDSMASLTSHVDIEALPKTFKEAVHITRKMRIRYLWIDSMCIVQPTKGDYEDWTREGPRMAEYYQNSAFTISASFGTDNNFGCFAMRPGMQLSTRPWPLFKEPIKRKWDPHGEMMGRDPDWLPVIHPEPCSWLWQAQHCPLSTRAWVLQERLLSRRILHCTVQGFMWECAEQRASEHEPLGCKFDYNVRDEGLLPVRKALQKGASFAEGQYWRQVVERFSGLDISYESDRLPALAGLAKAVQDETKDEYIAGHWKETLLTSLLWFRVASPEKRGDGAKATGAPSWSWASQPSPVKFTSLDDVDFPAISKEKYDITAEVLHVAATPESSNALSWVRESSLKLRGRMRRYSASEMPQIQVQNKSSDEIWHGYKPSSIPQIGHVTIPTEHQWNTVAEGVSKSGGGGSGKMADIAADNDQLQARIQDEMTAAMRQFKIPVKPAPEDVDVLDCVFDTEARDDLHLLEILCQGDGPQDLGVSQGLLLTRGKKDTAFERVGFFSLKTAKPVLLDADVTELELG